VTIRIAAVKNANQNVIPNSDVITDYFL